MQTAEACFFSADDFLVWEEQQQEKYEYIHTEVFSMGGALREHVLVSLNIASALMQHLRDTPCQAYISDMKLRIEQVDAFFYPDVMVSCAKEDHQAEQFLAFPSLIVEVLSDSTEAYDRGAKFSAYRHISSLKEYVLVDIKTRSVECFRRTAEDDWLLHVYADKDVCHFVSVDICVEMADVFEDIVENQQ